MPTNAAEAYDRGANGLAAQARPSRMVSVEAKTRGSTQRGEEIEALRYEDATVYDRLHAQRQLSDRQFVAARRIGMLWHGAHLSSGLCGGYGSVRGRSLTGDPDRRTAEDEYHDAMRALTAGQISRVQGMLHGTHSNWHHLTGLQDALSALADYWAIERDVDPAEAYEPAFDDE